MTDTSFGELLAEELGSASQIIECIINHSDSSSAEQPQLVLNDEARALLEYAKSSLDAAFEALLHLDF